MLSLVLSFGLLALWTALGAAILFAVQARVGLLRSWLLAPSIGLSFQVMAVCILNQAGLPVDRFARPLAVGMVVLAAALLSWRRPRFPGRALAPFIGAAAGFLLWAGWPAFRLGFNWISFVNDDFTNYCLSAERFRGSGFFEMPTLAQLTGRDYAQYFWFMHVLSLMRFGSEHALALVASVVGKNALNIFMPVILAFGGAQIFALGGLVLHFGRWRRQAAWGAVLLALSPVFIFGALYQLIAQVGGLALMLTTVALLTARLRPGRNRWPLLRLAIPAMLVASALAIFYPEVTPFAVLSVGAFLGLEWLTTRQLPGARIVLLNFTLMGWFVLLRYNVVSYVYTLAHQADSGVKAGDLSLTLFPFYLIPSGFAILFGFQPLPAIMPEPWGSILILLGATLFILIGVWAGRSLGRLRPAACMLGVELLMALYLFGHGNDFGLYKLAMFIQPVLWAGVAGWLLAFRNPGWRWGAAALVVLLGIPTAWYYTQGSTGMTHSGLTEMDHASEYLAHMPPAPGPDASWISNIDNVVSLKIAANRYRGTDLRFLSRDFFHWSTFGLDTGWPFVGWFPDPGIFHRGWELLAQRDVQMVSFDDLWNSRFDVVKEGRTPTGYVTLPPELDLFNKLNPVAPPNHQFLDVVPAATHDNLLAFVHSARGNHYYLGDRRFISFTQQEEDIFAPGGRWNSVGRFFLFRIERPTSPLYMRISASKSFMAPGHKLWSSGAVVQGATDTPLDFRGGGAANKIIGPITPKWRNGVAYIAIDFDEDPAPFPIHRSGLAALYHDWIPLDYRRMVAFARDMSAISGPQRDGLVRPRKLSSFPADIAGATGLEFSGIYEDGWVSYDADLGLGRSSPGESLRIKGMVPELPGWRPGQTLTASVNGGKSWQLSAEPGPFDWLIPIEHPGEHTDLVLHFSGHGVLPGRDQRPVAAKLELAEIVPNSIAGHPGGPRFPSHGIDTDGWAASGAEAWIPSPSAADHLALTLEYPGWPGVPAQGEVSISIDDGPARAYALKPGPNSLSVPLTPGPLLRHLRFEAKDAVQLPAPDGRKRAFRLAAAAAAP